MTAAATPLTLFDLDVVAPPFGRFGAWAVARRRGLCSRCGAGILVGELIRDDGHGRAVCQPCASDGTSPIQVLQVSGGLL